MSLPFFLFRSIFPNFPNAAAAAAAADSAIISRDDRPTDRLILRDCSSRRSRPSARYLRIFASIRGHDSIPRLPAHGYLSEEREKESFS